MLKTVDPLKPLIFLLKLQVYDVDLVRDLRSNIAGDSHLELIILAHAKPDCVVFKSAIVGVRFLGQVVVREVVNFVFEREGLVAEGLLKGRHLVLNCA